MRLAITLSAHPLAPERGKGIRADTHDFVTDLGRVHLRCRAPAFRPLRHSTRRCLCGAADLGADVPHPAVDFQRSTMFCTAASTARAMKADDGDLSILGGVRGMPGAVSKMFGDELVVYVCRPGHSTVFRNDRRV